MRAAVIYLTYLGWLIGVPLEILVIAALLRGAYRRFPAVFAYSVALFLTTVVEIAAYFAGQQAVRRFPFYYWVDEGIRQGLIFAVVISLIYRATAHTPGRVTIRLSLVGGAIL